MTTPQEMAAALLDAPGWNERREIIAAYLNKSYMDFRWGSEFSQSWVYSAAGEIGEAFDLAIKQYAAEHPTGV